MRGLLISNGKRKKNNENNNNIPVTVLNEVKNVIYDTSFIISNYSDFENMDGVIIPEVLEQLIYQEKVNKNSKVKKLFHMILDGNCRLRLLHDDVINDNEVQWYEDKADMAIILWAKSFRMLKYIPVIKHWPLDVYNKILSTVTLILKAMRKRIMK